MKKIILSISLLYSIPAYAMQEEFLTKDQVKKLKKELKQESRAIETLRQKDSDINCVQRAYQLLLQQHTNSSVHDLRACFELVKEQVSKKCMPMDDVNAMYEGMVWAGEIRKIVMANEAIQQLEKKVKEVSEDDQFIVFELFAKSAEKAVEELEKNESAKIFLNLIQTDEGSAERESAEKLYYESLLVPASYKQECSGMVNAKIKKLFAYYTNMVLGLDSLENCVSDILQRVESEQYESDESITLELSDEE
jgi:hypothetical protein